MVEMDEVDDVLQHDSTADFMWKKFEMDINFDRADHHRKLQSLKGKSVKLSPVKRNVKKHASKKNNNVKKFAKTRAFKVALNSLKKGMKGIKALTCKMQKSAESVASKGVCTSTMNFEVCHDPQEKDTVNLPCQEPSSGIESVPHSTEKIGCCRTDQSIQTQENCFEDKSSQTNSPQNLPLSSNRYMFGGDNPHIPVFLAPLGYTMFHGNIACCVNQPTHGCSCSMGQKRDKSVNELKEVEVQTIDNADVGVQQSLKQICDMLVQLCAHNNSRPEKNNIPASVDSVGNSTTVPNNFSQNFREPIDTNIDLQCGFVNQILNQVAASSNTLAENTSVGTQAPNSTSSEIPLSTEIDLVTTVSSCGALQTVPSLNQVTSCVTPDLLRDNICSLPQSLPLTETAVEIHSNQKNSELIQSPQNKRPELTESVNIEKAKQPVRLQCDRKKSSDTNTMEVLDVSTASTIPVRARSPVDDSLPAIIKNVNNLEEKDQCPSSDAIQASPLNSEERVSPVVTAVSPSMESKENTSSPSKSLLSKAKSGNGCYPLDELEESCSLVVCNKENINSDKIVNDLNAKDNEDCRAVPKKLSDFQTNNGSQDKLEYNIPRERGSKILTTQQFNKKQTGQLFESNSVCESKVLARVQSGDFADIPRNEGINSPAFEDMDPSEMESVLLIWRQQEQLHLDHKEPEKTTKSSPDFLFKKMKQAKELPAELQNVRILQPPPLKKMTNSKLSALDMLDEEVKRPNDGEIEEDVPEDSPKPVIQPLKRRRLRLTPAPRLPVVLHKGSKESSQVQNTCNEIVTSTPIEASEMKVKTQPKDQESEDEDLPLSCRVSKRLKFILNKSRENSPDLVESGLNIKQEKISNDVKNKAKEPSEQQESKKKIKKKADESDVPSSSVAVEKKKRKLYGKGSVQNGAKDDEALSENIELISNTQEGSQVQLKGKARKSLKVQKKEVVKVCTNDDEAGSVNEEKSSNIKKEFKDQIKERTEKLKQKWLQEKCIEIDGVDNSLTSTPTPAESSLPLSQESISTGFHITRAGELKRVPAFEVGKAHDLAVQILLNPWRGIQARQVSRGFVYPNYDSNSKAVVRLLWDLRSNANPEDVVENIVALGWKEVNIQALRSLVALFTLSFARDVPFVIEATVREDDDTCSISSDADFISKKKSTPIRVTATKEIFKGECIEGLNGLLLKASKRDKDKLKSWNFPKFQSRDWAIFGPLAYLKRRESDHNTQAVFFSGELIGVKAARNILSGERLLVSYEEVEASLFQ